jgi:outer membrane protein TolC
LRALQEESVGLAEAFEQAARRQVEAGTRAGIEATQLAVETTRARQLLLQAETSERLAAARLNTALGRPPEEPLPALEPLTYELGNWETGKLGNWAAKQGKLGNWAAKQGKPGRVTEFPNFLISQFPDSPISRRTEVVAEAERWQALRQEVQLIRAEGRPDLAVQARMETFTDRPRVGGLSVAVSLPLFDWGARRNRRRAAEQAADAQAARVEATANQVRLEVAQAQARVQLAEGLLQQYQAGVLEQAKRLADGAQKQLQAGVVSVLAVLEAQRTYRSVLADYTTALADLAQARAELEWALGLGDPAAR